MCRTSFSATISRNIALAYCTTCLNSLFIAFFLANSVRARAHACVSVSLCTCVCVDFDPDPDTAKRFDEKKIIYIHHTKANMFQTSFFEN